MADNNTSSTQKSSDSGVTVQRIQNILKGVDDGLKLNVSENVLHEYDNYNYHIKFYMADQNAAHIYTKTRRELSNNTTVAKNIIDKIHNNGSVIIAETGKTEDIIIESMTVETITSVPGRGISTTAEITLKLKELGGCSLVNKITYASKCLGQDSYVLSLYFIDLWFSGYKNYEYQTKTIEEKIPFISNRLGDETDDPDGEFLTYVMNISSVKTEKEGLNTNYTIKLVGTNFNLQMPNISTINMEKLEIKKGKPFDKIIEDLEKSLNKTLKEMLNSSVKDIYKDEEIIKFNIKNSSSGRADTSVGMDGDGSTPSQVNEPQTTGGSSSNVGKNPQASTSKTSEEQGGQSNSNRDFNINEHDNIYTAITKIWNVLNPMSGHIPVVDISQVALQETKVESQFNMLYPQYIVDIELIEYPGLKMRKEGMLSNANPTWSERILDEQYDVLQTLSKYGSLKRRYYNQYSGKNIDVLDIRENDDTMWYLNISTSEEKLVSENSTHTSQNKNKNENEKSESKDETKQSEEKQPPKTINELWEEGIKNDLKIIDTVRTGAIGFVNIFEPQDNNNPTGNGKADDVNAKKDSGDEKQAIARIGAENFLSVAQKIELKLTIIGDPYWLEFGSEMRGNKFCNAFPHVIFVYDVPHKLDGHDNYIRDEKMNWAVVYKVLNIKSHFDNGSFKQDITGVICNSFAFKDNFKTEPINQKADETVQAETSTVEPTRDVIAANVEQYKEDQKAWFITSVEEKDLIINNEAYKIIENDFPVYYYKDKDGTIKIVDWDMMIVDYYNKPPITLDPKIYKFIIDSKSNMMIIYNTETKEGVKYTYSQEMNPLEYTYGNENHLWNNSDEKGNVDGSKLIYDKKSDGTYDIYRIDEKGNPQKISNHDKNMYNVSETKKSDGNINLEIKNKRSGKTYNVANIKSMDNDIVESFQSSYTSKTDISQSNAIGKLEHTAYAREDNSFVINNMSTNKTDIVQLGYFDDDGSESSFNHSYSVYAEVKTDNGAIIKCYSTEDFNEAVSGSTKYSVAIKKETHPFWRKNTIETLNTYDNSIELGRLNRAFINTDYVSGKATHSKVE